MNIITLRYLNIFLKIAVIIICSLNCFRSLSELYRGKRTFQYYFYLLFYFFYVVPVILRIFFPEHQYIVFWKANEAMKDPLSNILYYIFALAFSHVIMRSGKKTVPAAPYRLTYNKLLIEVCTFIMIAVFLLTVAQNGTVLLHYGPPKGRNINGVLTECGTICYLALLGHRKYLSKSRLLVVTWIMVSLIWFVGKRYIMAETVILSIYVLSITGQLNGRKFIRTLACGSGAVILFCVIYALLFRRSHFISILDYFMVDMSRQYTLVYQFYCSMIGRQLSVNRFDAIMWILTFWIPRSLCPEKPYPFVNQLTYSLIGYNELDHLYNVGWATTCSVFSDLFDSFSWFGILLGIWLFEKLFQAINRTRKPHYKILLIYLSIRLLTVQIFSYIIALAICLCIFFICDVMGKNEARSTFRIRFTGLMTLKG